MGTEAEGRLEAADAALSAFEAKRTDVMRDLKNEGATVGDEYRAAHEAVMAEQTSAQVAVDEVVIQPEGVEGTDLGGIGA